MPDNIVKEVRDLYIDCLKNGVTLKSYKIDPVRLMLIKNYFLKLNPNTRFLTFEQRIEWMKKDIYVDNILLKLK